MKALFFLFFLAAICTTACAQTPVFGQVDVSDLKLNSCSFEKNADVMVLSDVARVEYNKSQQIIMQRHKRIKIFNERGLNAADIKIDFPNDSRYGAIKDIEAITYNLVDDQIEKTIIDTKELYTQKVDKNSRQIVIPFPKVKSGSIIEFRYKWQTNLGYNYPGWKFQNDLPTRYSRFDAGFIDNYGVKTVKNVNRGFVVDSLIKSRNSSRHIWAMKNIPSVRLEPYMHSLEDNFQYIAFHQSTFSNSWLAIATDIMEDEDFGKQMIQPLEGEGAIISKAKTFRTDADKIEFIFNAVKNIMIWNKKHAWYTESGTKKAWAKKTGNSAEINLILFHLLKSSGLSPMVALVGSRENAEIKADDPGYERLERVIVQMPLDSTQYLMLDATSKFNTYNVTPYELLGQNILVINPENRYSGVLRLKNDYPSEEVTLIEGTFGDDGRLSGTAQLSSSFYKRVDKLIEYDDLGKQKYVDKIRAGLNNLKISNYKMSNLGIDTLPLREDFSFMLEPAGVDGDYIYFNPNLFTGIGENPFLSESRFSDIDYIYLNRYNINGHFKLPKGYRIDAIPKAVSLAMPDKSVTFKRLVGEDNGNIIVHYLITFNKVNFSRDEYQALHNFYKKMYEALNEQIVLKKQAAEK